MLDYVRIVMGARLARMDQRGASVMEYGLLAAGIAALIVAVVLAFGGRIRDLFANGCPEVAANATDNATCTK